MAIRKKTALLVGQPEEKVQSTFIRRFIKQAFSEDKDVCIFAMYEKFQNTPNREKGESTIFSLIEYDMFEKIVIMADTIQTPGVLEDIEEKLHINYKKQVIFIGARSKYYDAISLKDYSFGKWKHSISGISNTKHTKSKDSDTFDFNEGTMTDRMLMQTEIQGLVDVINSNINNIKPFESFDLCLNIGWSDEGFLSEIGNYTGYSDNMLHVLHYSESDSSRNRADLSMEFSRKLILPALAEKREKPGAYFFSPLFFEEQCFGYAAINYGENIRCYDAEYKRWLSRIMHGMACFQRFNMLDIRKKQD